MTTRPLGKTQIGVLRALAGRTDLSDRPRPYPGGGWIWDTPSHTVRILESLTGRGLVDVTGEHRGIMGDFRRWHINDAGREAISQEGHKS